MDTTHSIQSIFEIIMIIVFMVGFKYEPSIAKWERKVFKKLRKVVNK